MALTIDSDNNSIFGITAQASGVCPLDGSSQVPDAQISQSSVTQHQAALSLTESQISDLTHTDADAIHDNVSGEIAAIAEKTSIVANDLVLIEDSAATNSKKRVTVSNLLNGGGGVFTADGSFAAYRGTNADAGDGSAVGAFAMGSYSVISTVGGTVFGASALGQSVTARNSSGVAGQYGIVAMGRNVTAENNISPIFAMGYNVTALSTTGLFIGDNLNMQYGGGGSCIISSGLNSWTPYGGSGAYSTLVVGSSMESGLYCAVVGNNCTASSTSISVGSNAHVKGTATEACVSVGSLSYVQGQVGLYTWGAMSLGKSNTATGLGSLAIGNNCKATGNTSLARGLYANSLINYEETQAIDATLQKKSYLLYNTTSDATQTELFANGSSQRIALADQDTFLFTAYVAGRRTDADNESIGTKLEGVIDRNGVTTALVGTVTTTTIGDDSSGTWNITAEADDTNDALVIKVTGEAAKTIKWLAKIELVKING